MWDGLDFSAEEEAYQSGFMRGKEAAGCGLRPGCNPYRDETLRKAFSEGWEDGRELYLENEATPDNGA